MLRVGLTGGIGSGKSTVARRLQSLGAVVVDADALAREVVRPGSPGLDAVVERFGDRVLGDDGGLDRAALGAVVFADPRARRDLEAITHPLIADRTAELVASAPADAVVVHDVPLIVEKDLGATYHLVVVVGADVETRVARLTGSRGMAEADARARVASQADDAQRRRAADVWLPNDGSVADVELAVDRLWHERLVPFERNVRDGVAARRADRLALVEADPGWPDEARRLLERLRRAFGGRAVTADHVGSTAVPGLVAKDVIDLQVGVPSLEAADDPVLLGRLRDAGFPRVDGVRVDVARGGNGPWPKRLHGNADPARVAHVHVRVVGSPGWRWALLFRDWLRADAAARAEYAAEKHRIAATRATAGEYAEAKEPWFARVDERADRWAAEAGWQPGPDR